MENLQAVAVIIGIVNGVRLLQEGNESTPKSYWGFVLFLVALIVGIILGLMHMFGLTVEMGIVAALASSGLYRVGEKVGGN